MRTKELLMASLLSLTVISCGQAEDQPQPDIVEDSPLESVTFSISTGEMSRAGTDNAEPSPTRAFMYVKDNTTGEILSKSQEERVSNGTFNFEIDLRRTHRYAIAFWADDEKYDIDSDKGLEVITYKREFVNNPGIAFSYQIDNFSPDGNSKQVVLTHAVGKLIIRESDVLDVNDRVSIAFDREDCTYSAITGEYKKTSTKTPVSIQFIADASNRSGDLISTYMLAPNSEKTSLMIDNINLEYTPDGDTESSKKRISYVPLKANRRTIVEGAFKGLSLVSQSFLVSVDTGWEGDDSLPSTGNDGDDINTPSSDVFEIALSSTVRLTSSMLDGIGDATTLKITGEMKDADFLVFRDYFSTNGAGESKRIALDLSKASFASMPEYAFSIDDEDIYDQTPINPMLALTSIILPEGLTAISKGAFIDCQNLKSITIPSSLTELGELSLYRSGITELNAPSVTTIDVDAVEDCPDLTTVVLGPLSKVGNNAFRNCPSLKEMDLTKCTGIPGGNQPVFGGSASTTPSINIYVSSTDIANAFKGSNNWNTKNHNWIVR